RLPQRARALLRRAARGFLAGYLPYTYGQAPAERIRNAAPALRRALERAPLVVPAPVRRLHPRLVSLTLEADGPARALATALVDDAAQPPYPVFARLRRGPAGWRVVGV